MDKIEQDWQHTKGTIFMSNPQEEAYDEWLNLNVFTNAPVEIARS